MPNPTLMQAVLALTSAETEEERNRRATVGGYFLSKMR